MKYLVKSGTVRTEKLIEIWTAISDEFRQIIHDIDSNYEFDLQKEVFADDKKILAAIAIVNQLRVRRNEELISILKNDLDFRLNYVDLSRDLDLTLKQIKFRTIQLRLKDSEQKELSEKKSDKRFTEYDFMEQLDVISEARGYHIKIDDLTVLEYTAIYNRFKNDLERKLRNV